MNYLKKTHPIARRRQKKRGKYHLTANNGKIPKEYTLPVGYLLRDILRLSRNLKETKKYLLSSEVYSGKNKITDIRYPISFLECLKVEKVSYRLRVYKKKKSNLFPVIENEIFSPVISKTRISPTQYNLNTLGGRCYRVNSDIIKSIPIGSTVIEKENRKPYVVKLVPTSHIFLLSGQNMGNLMAYKGFRNNQHIITAIFNKTQQIPYNEQSFFPITGEIIEI